MSQSCSLVEVLNNRRWLRRAHPFAHVVARNVFVQSFYERLAAAFEEVMSRGLSDQRSSNRLSRSMPGYDAYGMTFPVGQPEPFGLFLSRPWHDLLASLFQVQATGYVNCGLHHHPVGSEYGWVHNDLNPGWFVDYPSSDGVKLVRHDLCNYAFGDTVSNVTPLETIRAVAMLFYLDNPAWLPGDGGGTGLYCCKDDPVAKPFSVVPPINNSILVFECTPYSYHSFIRNWRQPRNSVIMWLHRPKVDVVARWGEGKIVNWPKNRS